VAAAVWQAISSEPMLPAIVNGVLHADNIFANVALFILGIALLTAESRPSVWLGDQLVRLIKRREGDSLRTTHIEQTPPNPTSNPTSFNPPNETPPPGSAIDEGELRKHPVPPPGRDAPSS
jgi:hypothetical protein